MTDDRSRIFSAIQAALAGRAQRAAYPEWDDALAVAAGVPDGVDPQTGFRSRFEEAGGQCFDGVETLIEHLARRGVRVGYCDPALGPAADPGSDQTAPASAAVSSRPGAPITRSAKPSPFGSHPSALVDDKR